MHILDEASQVIAYSHQLEEKSRELETATAELRAANERLQELDRLKDDFISTITHELRTPLTSIRAFSEILHDNPDLEPEQRDRFLGIIIKESERLTRLINQVLDLAKIESGSAEWRIGAARSARGDRGGGGGGERQLSRSTTPASRLDLPDAHARPSSPIATGSSRSSSTSSPTPPSSATARRGLITVRLCR